MKYLFLNKHWRLNKEYNIDKLLYLMIDRPNKISIYKNFIWRNRNNKNQLHRDYDLPPFVYQYENKIRINLYWYENGKQHRKNNKPAYIRFDGYKEYHINDKFIRNE